LVGIHCNIAAIVSIGDNASDRTRQERSQHPDDEQTADGKTRFCERRDQGGRSDQVEPVTEKADNLAKPKKTKARVLPNQLEVAGRALLRHFIQFRVTRRSAGLKVVNAFYDRTPDRQ
jgi:hypothetical protein